MKRGLKIFLILILFIASLAIVALVWIIPISTLRINSSFTSLFLSDHSTDTLSKPIFFGIESNRVEEFSFITRDGIRIAALRVSAKEGADKKGAIVFLHGIRRAKECVYPMASYFSERGYDCFAMDFRSHGRSEGDLITYGHLERVDVKFFLDYIYDHYGLSEKLVLWGQSMGAAVAFLVAESDSRVNLLISESTYASFNSVTMDYFSYIIGFRSSFAQSIILKSVSRISGLNPDEISPLNAAKNIKIPIFIAHGMLDNKMNPLYAQELFSELGSDRCRIMMIPDANHLDFWEKGGENYFREVEQFIDSNNVKILSYDR